MMVKLTRRIGEPSILDEYGGEHENQREKEKDREEYVYYKFKPGRESGVYDIDPYITPVIVRIG